MNSCYNLFMEIDLLIAETALAVITLWVGIHPLAVSEEDRVLWLTALQLWVTDQPQLAYR
jgi:hypothetical protein